MVLNIKTHQIFLRINVFTFFRLLYFLQRLLNMTVSNPDLEYTKCILSEGDNTKSSIKEGQWFKIKCKQLFDSSIFGQLSSDVLIGFKVNRDHFSEIRLRLGDFHMINKFNLN